MELNIGAQDPIERIMLHIRGGGDPVTTALRLTRLLGCRALDFSTGEFLTDDVDGGSWEEFQDYRDQAVEGPGD